MTTARVHGGGHEHGIARHASILERLRPRPAHDSLLSQRATLYLSMRALTHAGLTFDGMVRRRSPRWLTLGAVSLSIDLAMARRCARDDRPLPLAAHLLDALDAVLWCGAGTADPVTTRAIHLATAVPGAVEAGYRFAAGTDATPVPDPPTAFPPPSPTELGRTLARSLAPVLVPSLALSGARRARGWPAATNQVTWSLLGFGIGAVFARQRHALQRRVRRRWTDRSAYQVELEQQAVRSNFVSSPTVGHHLASALVQVGQGFGSRPALDAGLAALAYPREVMEGHPGGRTLGEAADWVDVDPDDATRLWITTAEEQVLDHFMQQAEDAAPEGLPMKMVVTRARHTEVEVAYLGRRITLRNQPPPLDAILTPAAPALLLTAVWKACAALPTMGTVHPLAALTAASIDLASFGRYLSHPPSPRDSRRIVRDALVATTVLDGAVIAGRFRRSTPLGNDTYPSGLMGFLLVLAYLWDDLDPIDRWTALAAATSASLAAATVPGGFRARTFVSSAPYTLMPAVAMVGMRRRVDAEEDALAARCQRDFAAAADAARDEAILEELDRYASLAALLDRELDALAGSIEPDDEAAFRRRANDARAWVTDVRNSLDGP